jgi:fumarate reductase subunit D
VRAPKEKALKDFKIQKVLAPQVSYAMASILKAGTVRINKPIGMIVVDQPVHSRLLLTNRGWRIGVLVQIFLTSAGLMWGKLHNLPHTYFKN